jgi:single-stranded DNA-binding protein
MTSQIYLRGRLSDNPELSQTKNGKLRVKILLSTQLLREKPPGEVQSESITLPVTFFSSPAEVVKELKRGAEITVGAHLYGTEFQDGNTVRHGVQITADVVFVGKTS